MVNANAKLKDNVKRYLQLIGDYPTLTQEEEIALCQRIANGDDAAKDYFIRCNLKLVVSVAKQYANFSVSFMDLIQEGNMGLCKAIEKFDPSLGYKFSTYGIQWIRQYISRYIMDKGNLIHIPIHVLENEFKVRKAFDKLYKDFQREPTIMELAEETGFSEYKIQDLLSLAKDTISIDMQINEDQDTRLSDLIADPDTGSLSGDADEVFVHEDIIKSLNILNDREREIIIRHFGLNDEPPMTLEDIGKLYGITRERVRQIESKAMRKLRTSKTRIELEEYYHDL